MYPDFLTWTHHLCEMISRVPIYHRHLSHRKFSNLPWLLSCYIHYLRIYLPVSTMRELHLHYHKSTSLVGCVIIQENNSWWCQGPQCLQTIRWKFQLAYMDSGMLLPHHIARQIILLLRETRLVQSEFFLRCLLLQVKTTLCSQLLGLAYNP